MSQGAVSTPPRRGSQKKGGVRAGNQHAEWLRYTRVGAPGGAATGLGDVFVSCSKPSNGRHPGAARGFYTAARI
jgi:hypothetical protein